MKDTRLGEEAKQVLAEFAEMVDQSLKRYWDEEIEENCFGFGKKQRQLSEKILFHLREHSLRPGKRLRAFLVWYGYKLGGKEIEKEKLMRACMAVELVHTALLIQDDFMDEDVLRRNKPTSHVYFAEDGDRHYGESMAVIVSDIALTLGYKLLLESGFEDGAAQKALSIFLRGVINTGYGQALDMNMGREGNWKEKDVLALHKTKTAIYTYDNPLRIGAVLGRVSGRVTKALGEYAMKAGVAFQLQDDLLGMWGDSKKTGKSSNSDILQGKRTLIVLKALEMGSEDIVKKIKKVWGAKKADDKQIEIAKEAIKESGAYEYNVNMAREEAKRAEMIIEGLRKVKGLDREALDYLQGIATYMVNREL